MTELAWRFASGEWGLFCPEGFVDRGFASEVAAERAGSEHYEEIEELRVERMCACGADVPDGACDACEDEAYLERPEPDYEAWVEEREMRRYERES
jgi:hypothetical protein